MALRKQKKEQKLLALLALSITLFLFLVIIIMGSVMNNKREEVLNEQFEKMYQDFNNMQVLSLLSDTYGGEMACLAFESKIKDLDKYIWKLGSQIDKYRTASEEFQKDEYYLKQKKIFNENELYYLLLLKKMTDQCKIDKQIILFFYQNAVDCRKCDDQSFILTDINLLDEEDKSDKDIAVFSFDMDINLTSLEILSKYYKIDRFPCVIINEQKYCGIQDKDFIMEKICDGKEIDICNRYKNK